MKSNITRLPFQPRFGLSSPHFQMIAASFLPQGESPPSEALLIDLSRGDFLSCSLSVPSGWKEGDQTVVLVHGLGGSHLSGYMVRMGRKLYKAGKRVVRVNLRGCGPGKGLSKLPYHGGTSGDLLKVVEYLQQSTPRSRIAVVGFSLGGNIALKLAGELGSSACGLIEKFIAVCPPVDLELSVRAISEKRNALYHKYYLKNMHSQTITEVFPKARSIYEFDDRITAPPWGYKGAYEFYANVSSNRFLAGIRQTTHILFARDDPFIPPRQFDSAPISDAVRLWETEKGGHMGFLGNTSNEHGMYFMDHRLFLWIDDTFREPFLLYLLIMYNYHFSIPSLS